MVTIHIGPIKPPTSSHHSSETWSIRLNATMIDMYSSPLEDSLSQHQDL
jgi:hypothetical protein